VPSAVVNLVEVRPASLDAIAIRRTGARRSARPAAYFAATSLACAITAAALEIKAASRDATATPTDVGVERPRRDHGIAERAAVDVEAGIGVFGRSFLFDDRGTPNLRDYTLYATPMPYAQVEAWPSALFGAFPVDVGLLLGGASTVGFGSTIDGASVPTSWTRWNLGVAARVAMPRGFARVTVSYDRDRFAYSTSDPVLAVEVPQTDYASLRVGADGRLSLGRGTGRVALLAGFAWRFVQLGARDGSSLSQVSDRFPQATVGGLDAHVGVVVPLARVMRGLEARATFEYTRWFYAMHPALGDAYVAGGALDQRFGVRLGAAWCW
jgi:hypothetical protein